MINKEVGSADPSFTSLGKKVKNIQKDKNLFKRVLQNIFGYDILAHRKRSIKRRKQKMERVKKIALSLVILGLVLLFPVTAEAKTKTLSFNIDKVSSNDFVKKVQSQGIKAHYKEKDKNTYKIKITVKAESLKDGRKKVKSFAKKVQKAKDNTYGLSYGVSPDDGYNWDTYDKKTGTYITELFNTCNDIFFLNEITKKALKQDVITTTKYDDGWTYPVGAYTDKLFPESDSFKESSDSVKVQLIVSYIDSYCFIGDIDYHSPVTWKSLYNGTAIGACNVFSQTCIKATRLIAQDYQAERESNHDVNHEIALTAVKNSKGTYDYFYNGSDTFYVDTSVKYTKYETYCLDSWMIVAPKIYKSSKLEKAAYKYGVAHKRSELDKMILAYNK